MLEAEAVVLTMVVVHPVDPVVVEMALVNQELTDLAAEAAEVLVHHKLVEMVAMVSLFYLVLQQVILEQQQVHLT
jgi:hypothetical protein